MIKLKYIVCIPALVCSFYPILASAQDRLVTVKKIEIPGAPARFDYSAIDQQNARLYVNQEGANRTLVFSTHNYRFRGEISGISQPTGITITPRGNLAFISSPGYPLLAPPDRPHVWGNGVVDVVNLINLRVVRKLPVSIFPDGSAWVPKESRLFVSNERAGREVVIGGDPMRVLASIPLGGQAGNVVYDPRTKRIIVNIQTLNQIAVINPKSLKITRRISLPQGCVNNHGLLLDTSKNLAFIACTGHLHLPPGEVKNDQSKILVMRLPNFKALQFNIVGENPDVLSLDTVRQRLWVGSESGVVAVFKIGSEVAKPMKNIWFGWVGSDAHSVAVDPKTGFAWFPLLDVNGHSEIRVVKLEQLGSA